MQLKQIPPLGPRYWSSLFLSALFGADAGDVLADQAGLWVLAVLSIRLSSIQTIWHRLRSTNDVSPPVGTDRQWCPARLSSRS